MEDTYTETDTAHEPSGNRFGIGNDPLNQGRTLRRGDGRLAGVSAGLATYFDVDTTIVRLAWVAAGLTMGPVALFAYAAAGIVMDDSTGDAAPADLAVDEDTDEDTDTDTGDDVPSIAVAS